MPVTLLEGDAVFEPDRHRIRAQFGFPGIGTVLFQAIKGVDYPVIQGIVLTIILTLATTTLILDLTLPMLDPRISRRT